MFHRIKKLKSFEQALFALLIGFAIVSFWRGTQGLMDLYLFPRNHELSLWFSIIFGLIILTATHYWTKKYA